MKGRDTQSSAGDVSDQQLMVALRAGDRSALQDLMDRYWAPLVRYGEGMLRSKDDAEDIAQEVFIRTWQFRARWADEGAVQAYLYRIARNLILDRERLRQIRIKKVPAIRRQAKAPSSPVEDLQETEFRDAVEVALAKLPERRREAFLLTRIQGLPLSEAAEIMGVTRQTAANHIQLALADLRAELSLFLS